MLYVLKTAGLLVDEIFARTVAVNAARNRNFVVIGPELLLAVGEGDRNFGETEGLTRIGSVENDIDEFRAAKRGRALLAEHPADGVGNVGLAAAVGPDDGDKTRLERQARLVGEALEADHI